MPDEFWLEEMNQDGFSAFENIMRGDPGPYFTPAVDSSGNISWTNNGNLPNPEPRNIKGDKGDPGDKGDKGDPGDKGDKGDPGEVTQAELDAAIATKAPVIINTASGTIASFDDGADGLPLKKLVVNIEPVQAGSGDPSPQNVRAISGWTGASIYREAVYDSSASPIVEIPFPTPPGTVYGGTLTINADGSGELVVDKVGVSFDGSENWIGFADSNVVHLDRAFPGMAYFTSESTPACLCNFLKEASVISNSSQAASRPDNSFFNQSAAYITRLWIKDTTYINNLEGFKEALATTPLQIVYPLNTLITYRFDDLTQLTTLIGTNNIWADCGPVSVDYPADTKLYIQKVNKPTDDDMTADSQIDSGKYFLINNSLYLSTTVIPAGDTIIPGTNCTKTNLAAALNALNT